MLGVSGQSHVFPLVIVKQAPKRHIFVLGDMVLIFIVFIILFKAAHMQPQHQKLANLLHCFFFMLYLLPDLGFIFDYSCKCPGSFPSQFVVDSLVVDILGSNALVGWQEE